MNRGNTNDLGHERVGRLLARLALPAITAQVINMLYNIVDRVYIGHIADVGPAALTGVGVCFPILMIIAAFSALIGMGGAPRAAIQMGRGDNRGAERIMGNCFTMLLAASAVLTAVFLAFGDALLTLFGASPDTLPYASEYMRIYVCGTLFVQMSMGLNSFITTQGFATTSMLTVTIGAVVNIALDPLFIFTFGMGVKGAALATVISQAVSCAWVLLFLTGKKTVLRIRREDLRPRRTIVLPVLALGVSPFIMQSTESLLSVCFNTSLQKYGGDVMVGAMTILTSVMQIVSLPTMGLAQGAQPIISYNFGAGNMDRVREAFKKLLVTALCFTTALWLVAMLAPQLLISLFSSDPELMAATRWAMRIYMAVSLIMGVQNACQQTFVAIGQAKASLFLALLRKIILLIPLIYILPLFMSDKVFAVFLAEPVADFLAVTVTGTLFAVQFTKLTRPRTAT